MYHVIFYEDKNGKSEVLDFIHGLNRKAQDGNKDARVNLRKIGTYMDALIEEGTRIGEPVTKHLSGEIWELRPLKNRILYAYYENDTFIILHHFVKKTRKTPRREIERALNNLADYRERNGE
jgi:phage-related protein